MARPLSLTVTASQDTNQYKYGLKSATNGTITVDGSGGDFDFGTGAHTIEFYIRFDEAPTASVINLFTGDLQTCRLTRNSNTGLYGLQWFQTSSGGALDFGYGSGSVSLGADTWYHIVFSRNSAGNEINGWIDGQNIFQRDSVDTSIPVDYGDLVFYLGSTDWFDEIRVSDIQRYDGNFYPLSQAFQDDSNTKVLINMEGAAIEDNPAQQGSGNLSATLTQTATANPSPSMVFIRDDYPLTWDDTDTWERIGGIQDSWWPGYRYPLVSFNFTANNLIVKFGESSLSATAIVIAKGGVRKDGASSQSAEFTLESGSDLYRNAAADLTAFVAQISTGERLPQGSASLSVTATLTSGSDLYKNAQSDLTAEFDLVSAGRNLKLAQIDIDDFATMSVAAQVELNAQANLSGEFTLTPRGGFLITIPEPYDYTWDTIPGDTWDSYFKDLWEPQGWFAFSTAELTAESSTGLEGEADLSSSTDLSAQADITRTVSATLAVTATVTAKGNYLQIGSADLEAFVAQVTVGEKILAGSSNLESLFTISADSEILRNAESNLSAVAALDARAGVELNASSSLEAFVAQVTAGQRLPQGSASLTVNTELTAVADLLFAVEVNLSAETDITTNAEILRGGRSNLIAFAAELVAGQRLPGGSADLTVVAGLTAKVGVILSTAQSDLEGFFAQVTVGRQSNVRGDASLASSFTAIFEGDLQLLESDFEIPVLSETRQYMVKSEIRDFSVLVDSRQHTVKSETNNFLVLPETRTLEIEV